MKIEVKQVADDNPGLLQRYRRQEVEQSPEVPICVIKDGLCNHADYDIEEDTPTDKVIVCTNCDAWRYVNDFTGLGWNDETFKENEDES